STRAAPRIVTPVKFTSRKLAPVRSTSRNSAPVRRTSPNRDPVMFSLVKSATRPACHGLIHRRAVSPPRLHAQARAVGPHDPGFRRDARQISCLTQSPGSPETLVAVIPGQARGMADVLQRLARCPVVVAPMAGGSSTAGLVTAVSAAGALGFLAAGYKSAATMRAEMDEAGAGSAAPFGVNLVVPGGPTDPAGLRD